MITDPAQFAGIVDNSIFFGVNFTYGREISESLMPISRRYFDGVVWK